MSEQQTTANEESRTVDNVSEQTTTGISQNAQQSETIPLNPQTNSDNVPNGSPSVPFLKI